MKATISRSAIIASVLLIGLIVFSAQTSIAETLLFQLQPQKKNPKRILPIRSAKLKRLKPTELPPPWLGSRKLLYRHRHMSRRPTASGQNREWQDGRQRVNCR